MRAILLTAGAALLAARILRVGAKSVGPGRRIMGLIVLGRLAAQYGPALLGGLRRAHRKYQQAAAEPVYRESREVRVIAKRPESVAP